MGDLRGRRLGRLATATRNGTFTLVCSSIARVFWLTGGRKLCE